MMPLTDSAIWIAAFSVVVLAALERGLFRCQPGDPIGADN